MSINLQARLNTTLITVNIDQVIVRYNVRNNGGMVEEVVEESNSVIVPLRAIHCCHDGVVGENSGMSAGEDRVEGHFGGGIEVSGVYERLHAVVEVEAGGIRVSWEWREGVPTEGVEWGGSIRRWCSLAASSAEEKEKVRVGAGVRWGGILGLGL